MASILSSYDGSPRQSRICQGSLPGIDAASTLVSPESNNQTLLCQGTSRQERLSKDSGVSEHGSESNSRNQEDLGSLTFADEDDEDDMENSALLKEYGENLTSIHQHVQKPLLLNYEDSLQNRKISFNNEEMDMNSKNESHIKSSDENMGGAGISVIVSDDREIHGIQNSECHDGNEQSTKYMQSLTQSNLKSPTSAVIPCSSKHSERDLHQHLQKQTQREVGSGESSKRWQLKCGTSDYSSISSCESQRGQDGHDPANEERSPTETVLSASNIARSSGNLCGLNAHPSSGCMRAGSRNSSRAHVQFNTETERKNQGNQVLQCDTFILADGSVELNTNEPSQNQDHLAARLWSKLIPESSPSEEPYSLKKKRRQISTSSSISMDSGTSASTDSQESYVRPAPDGGWGWVVVAASFMVHCIADGVTMSFGVIFVEFLDYFQESKSLTSWIGSLFMSIPLLAGPIASLLTDRYGCKKVTIIGAIVASFGFFISAFANTIPVLLITVGIITGLGLAVCYVAAIVIVAFYFEKKRSLATGIAVAGSGIGTFLFAPLIQYFIDNWGWRLTLIFLAGIFLNMVVSGMLMRDLQWKKRKKPQNSNANTTAISSNHGSNSHSSETVGENIPNLNELRRLVKSGDICALLSPDDIPYDGIPNSSSLILLPTYVSQSQQLPTDVLPWLSGSSKVNAYELVSQMYPHLLSRSMSDHLTNIETTIDKIPDAQTHDEGTKNKYNEKLKSKYFKDGPKNKKQLTRGNSGNLGSVISPQQATARKNLELALHMNESNHTGITQEDKNKIQIELGGDDAEEDLENIGSAAERTAMLQMYRRRQSRHMSLRTTQSTGCMGTVSPTQHVSAPLRNMRVNRQSMTYRGAMLNIHRYRLRASSCPDIYRNSIITIAKTEDENIWNYFDDMKEMMTSCSDYSYCSDPGFLIFSLSNFILYVFYDTVYMYLLDYATEVGVPADDAANLISAIGILNCVGMIAMGYAGDQPWASPMYIYNVSMVLCGISVIFMPMVTDYYLLAAIASVFGLFISANYALTSVILVDLVSLDAFSQAYGMLLLIQGVANLIGPPLVGLIADTTGSYTLPFVVSGIFIVICGLILNLIPLFKRCQGHPGPTKSPVSTPPAPQDKSRQTTPIKV